MTSRRLDHLLLSQHGTLHLCGSAAGHIGAIVRLNMSVRSTSVPRCSRSLQGHRGETRPVYPKVDPGRHDGIGCICDTMRRRWDAEARRLRQWLDKASEESN